MVIKRRYWFLALAIALLLHALLFFLLSYLPQSVPSLIQNSKSKNKIHVQLKPKLRKQVVQTAPPKESKIPKQADYLSEFNHQTEQQTQNKDFSKSNASKPPKINPVPHPKLGLKPKLIPTWQDLENLQTQASDSHSLDYLKDLKTGVESNLNTFEWKHASYFNRIKENVAQAWSPLLQIKRYDPGAALIGNQDRLTVVEITLDSKGKVVQSHIKNPSGVFYLDDEAIHAFQEASPFPNPPKALFAEKNSFSFTFGFYVNVQKGFSLDFD